MRLLSFTNLRDCFTLRWQYSANEALQYIRLGLLQEDDEKGWKQDVTLANSGICLKPFKFDVLLMHMAALGILL